MRRSDLVPDCGSCAALCCVATSFEVSDDFAVAKAAGADCQHLLRARRCAIHGELAARGFPGCVVYDCYGAGQRASLAFAGTRNAKRQRNDAFLILRVVHEQLWLLTEASKLCPSTHTELKTQLALETAALDAIARSPATVLPELDLRPHRDLARALLRRVGDALGGRRRPVRSLVVIP